ncbi:MAG: radical SAM protein [Pirellulales bacterium]|nr:radical SAM protein [Pirellulales bacterium]
MDNLQRSIDERFLLEPFEPAYLALTQSGELARRVVAGLRELESCAACPRHCRVNRIENDKKVCQTGRFARVASAAPHHGEEGCLSGWNGSGTIFFAGCNLKCVFCQNWDISQRGMGEEMDSDQIADMMLALQARGCHNINFVTPEHVVPQVIEAIASATERGLHLPIVYNTSAYDSLESLKLLDGIVDIYMPDFKFWNNTSAKQLVKAEDYPERARAAILEMHHQVGVLRFGPDGLARRGVLVRHLVMPGLLGETESIMNWLAEAVSVDTFVNIMGQYHPAYQVGTFAIDGTPKYSSINRCLHTEEMETAFTAARQVGLWRFD